MSKRLIAGRAALNRILYLTTVEVTIHALLIPHIKALQKRGYEVEVACKLGKFESRIKTEGIKTYYIPFERNMFSIKNVIANNNSFSFVIDLSGTPLGTGRTIQVVGNKRHGQYEYDIEATALWWSDIINRKIKTEWRSTNKAFILPYKEVF